VSSAFSRLGARPNSPCTGRSKGRSPSFLEDSCRMTPAAYSRAGSRTTRRAEVVAIYTGAGGEDPHRAARPLPPLSPRHDRGMDHAAGARRNSVTVATARPRAHLGGLLHRAAARDLTLVGLSRERSCYLPVGRCVAPRLKPERPRPPGNAPRAPPCTAGRVRRTSNCSA
jgi:hypothetical protein